MTDEILTAQEAADALKTTSDVVEGLLESGELPGRKIGGEWRTTQRALISYVDGIPNGMVCCTPSDCCPPTSQATFEIGQNPSGGCCC
jgi:excisionase family DNA binding protein